MYTAYFGLSEAPFTIAPDPAYLFMSDRHREALAHLTYGLGDNGGFVLLTGEVGTGKTTISRSVMEQLPENTQAAFILNPTLSCTELLATICDNLKIRYKKTGATLKYLTDKIQNKLIANHENNVNTLLIIDEAQHLQPEVLEQLRLLTNLETNTKKLLQVILIGQPELQQLLQRRDLRQLAQRITARYHLMPLTREELVSYIQHRLSVAQCTRKLFDDRAISALHQISQGIPRIVNLLCDRALILAYSANQTVVNKKTMLIAAQEALGEAPKISFWHRPFIKALSAVAVMLIVLIAGIVGGNYIQFKVPSVSVVPKESDTKKDEVKIVKEVTPEKIPEQVIASSNEINAQISKELAQVATDDISSKKSSTEAESPEEPLILGYKADDYKQRDKGKITLVAEDGVSADVLERFQQAIEDTESDSLLQAEAESGLLIDTSNLLAIHELSSEIQNALPSLQFDLHMFATEGKGWVRVNGAEHVEGDTIAPELVLVSILPQKVVLSYKEQRFSMPALSSW